MPCLPVSFGLGVQHRLTHEVYRSRSPFSPEAVCIGQAARAQSVKPACEANTMIRHTNARHLGFPGLVLLLCFAGCSSCVERNRPPESRPEVADEPVGELRRPAGTGEAAKPGEARRIRKAAVAGSWYYDEAAKLGPFLDEVMAGAEGAAMEGPIAALVSPHAGYAFSGKAAAAGYRLLKGQDIRRVIILAPSHYAAFDGASIADVTHYETPLGLIPLDLQAVARLRKLAQVQAHASAHEKEHSLEMQLPMLQRVISGFHLIPILIGEMSEKDYRDLADALSEVVDHQTLVVASSDFTHRGPSYSYELPPGKGALKDRLRALDEGTAQRILALDRPALLAYARQTGTTVCGLRPIALLVEVLRRFDRVEGQVISHYTSGDVMGDWTNTVSYLDIAFRAKFPKISKYAISRLSGEASFPLTIQEKRILLKLARETLDASVKRGAHDPEPLNKLILSDSLKRKAGAFVTLKCRRGPQAICTGKGEDLRGCIGTIAPLEGVAETVSERAASAALDDPRFPSKVSTAELPFITVEVSVLTPPRKVKTVEEIIIGRHGIILERDGHGATFLPQVPPEQGWDRDETLRQLSEKAGLPSEAWKEAATSYQVYEAIVFSEDDPGAEPR